MKQSDKLVPLAACAVITAWVAFTTTAIANEDTTNLTMPFEDSAPETSITETSTIGRSANVESKLSAEFAEFLGGDEQAGHAVGGVGLRPAGHARVEFALPAQHPHRDPAHADVVVDRVMLYPDDHVDHADPEIIGMLKALKDGLEANDADAIGGQIERLNPIDYIEATLRNEGQAQFAADGNVVTKDGKPWIGGNPFPDPGYPTGKLVARNHRERDKRVCPVPRVQV